MEVWKNIRDNRIFTTQNPMELTDYFYNNRLNFDEVEFLFSDGYNEHNIRN